MIPDEKTLSETDIQTALDRPMGGKQNVIMDATILTALMGCPRLSDFRFNHNFISLGGKSNSLECGLIVHTFMEYYYKSIIGGLKRDTAFGYGISAAELYIRGCRECSDFQPIHDEPVVIITDPGYFHVCNSKCILRPKCGHKPNEFTGVVNTPKDSEGHKTGWQWVLDSCDQYHNHYRGDHWQPLEIEVVKGEVLYEDDEVRVLWKAKFDGKFDTNQGIFPMDHKTMKQRRNTNSMNNQFIGQCLLSKTNQVIINKFGFQTSLKPHEKFERKPVAYTNERLLEWQGVILPYYAKLLVMYSETGYFPPNFSQCEGKYGNCAFYEPVCSQNPSMRESQLKLYFKVGPEWNPTNENEDD